MVAPNLVEPGDNLVPFPVHRSLAAHVAYQTSPKRPPDNFGGQQRNPGCGDELPPPFTRNGSAPTDILLKKPS